MLDHLTQGRLEIGTAAGIPQEMAQVGLSVAEARERNDEAIEIIDAALARAGDLASRQVLAVHRPAPGAAPDAAAASAEMGHCDQRGIRPQGGAARRQDLHRLPSDRARAQHLRCLSRGSRARRHARAAQSNSRCAARSRSAQTMRRCARRRAPRAADARALARRSAAVSAGARGVRHAHLARLLHRQRRVHRRRAGHAWRSRRSRSAARSAPGISWRRSIATRGASNCATRGRCSGRRWCRRCGGRRWGKEQGAKGEEGGPGGRTVSATLRLSLRAQRSNLPRVTHILLSAVGAARAASVCVGGRQIYRRGAETQRPLRRIY